MWKFHNPIALTPTASDFGAAAKKSQFASWLVSQGTPSKLIDKDFANKAAVVAKP